ncbi:hypothetical protein MBLNU230_g2179t1 [Neophaeotheca triangularis]
MNGTSGYVAGDHDDTALPIFDVQKVQLRFDISADFVAAQVANNVLILALSTGRILRFDLDNAEDIDDIDLPKRPAEIGVIRKLFLDPSASHLIISTTLGENFYLHTQSRQPKALSRLKGVQIESIAWSPSQPTASTREILIGAADGNVHETYVEPSTEFYRREEKYVKNVYNPQDGAVVGIYADITQARPETRRVVVATQHKLLHFTGRTGRQGYEGSGSVYSKLFESETPTVHEIDRTAAAPAHSCLAVSPDPSEDATSATDSQSTQRAYAWLNNQGVYNGTLLTTSPDPATLGRKVFHDSKLLPKSKFPPLQTTGGRPRTTQPPITSMCLSQFHVLALMEGRITAINRLDDSVVYNQEVLETGQTSLGLFADHQKNTYWLFTQREIFEVVATDEARDVWRIMLKQGDYEAAQRYATTASQKDAVASTTGEHLMTQGKYAEAAALLGKSSKAFEDVALSFIDHGESDALRKYLLVKLANMKKSYIMQRTMLASWLVELYIAKLNQLDDTISTKAELTEGSTASDTKKELPIIRKEFQDFVSKYKSDLDRKTTYEIISAHGREEELLHYASVVDDHNYVLTYWVQRERWAEAMDVLKKQTDPEVFYRYSTVLMSHVPVPLTEVLMRQSDLSAQKLIPALLNYNKTVGSSLPINQNQAIRYLLFCINHHHSTAAAVHNTLISLYASHPSPDESSLLTYLETQSNARERNYDADFALRLCITHKRIKSAAHIYSSMQHYSSAVDLALRHNETTLAAQIADYPSRDPAQRKKLWLKVAKTVISQTHSIKAAMDFLKSCDLLRIEDLIPFFPDFVVIDDFKEEICAALEEYSRQIDGLKSEMDDSATTAENIRASIKDLDQRYAIVEPGERCWRCRMPLLMRQFFVFPCQHAFHADCLGEVVMGQVGMGRGKRIRELQGQVGRAAVGATKRQGLVRELDGLVGGQCVLCSEVAVRGVDEPFIRAGDDPEEWAV